MIVDKFSEIFAGNKDGYGLYQDGKHIFVKKPVIKELYNQHLTGKISLGIVPIRADNKCKFGALDLDDHKKGGIKKDFDYNKSIFNGMDFSSRRKAYPKENGVCVGL